MIKKIKISRDNERFCAAILTDLTKAFDCIRYDLLIAKLNAYGFDQEVLKFIHRYRVIDRKKLFCIFRYFVQFFSKSILGPLLFVICFLLMSSDVVDYADDTAPYECTPYYDKLKEKMEFTIYEMFNWFKIISKPMLLNVIFFLSPYQSATRNIDGSIIKIVIHKKLLGVTIHASCNL